MLRWLQDKPRLLEGLYDFTHDALVPFRRWLKPGGFVEKTFIVAEEVGKGAIFNCQMCGECVLHSTGMTCPMNCPKNLRNGPCGGVRMNGHCEVKPEMKCVWVQAWERSAEMGEYRTDILDIVQPLNRRLEGTSAWINDFTGSALQPMPGWIGVNEIAVRDSAKQVKA
jgi:hypothetical protein